LRSRALTAALAITSIAPIAISSDAGASAGVHGTRSAATSAYVVPLYDASGADWATTCGALASSNSFVVADIGSSSGPGTSGSASWSGNFLECDATHVGVLGYVDSDYCHVSLATVESQVDNWYAWYAGDGLTGIFVDEVANPSSATSKSDCLSKTMSALSYYQTIAAYIHAEGVYQTVAFNYGRNPVSGWALANRYAAQNANILVTFEGPYASYVDYQGSGQAWSPASWESSYAASHFSVLVYDASNNNLPGAFCAVVSQQNVLYSYATPNSGWTTPAPAAYLTSEQNSC
jgi:hypothetical protein